MDLKLYILYYRKEDFLTKNFKALQCCRIGIDFFFGLWIKIL